VLTLECHVTPHRPEKGAQHETQRFGIFDPSPMAYKEKSLGYLFGQRLVFDMLHAQTCERPLPFHAKSGFLAERWIDNVFLKGMGHLQGGKQRLRHPQALSPVDKAGQTVSNRFKCCAQVQLYPEMCVASLAQQAPLRRASAREGAAFIGGVDRRPGQDGLVGSGGSAIT